MTKIIVNCSMFADSSIVIDMDGQQQTLEKGSITEIKNNVTDYCYHFNTDEVFIIGNSQYSTPIVEAVNHINAIKYNNNKKINIVEVYNT